MANYEESLKKAEATTTWEVRNRPNWMEIRDAVIIWPDFTGRIRGFHKKLGEKRSFSIVLNDNLFEALHKYEADRKAKTGIDSKFNINYKPLYTEEYRQRMGLEQVMLPTINVKVNYANEENPPLIKLYSTYNGERSHQLLTAETATILDSIEMESADMKISFYSSAEYPESISVYLRTLNVIQVPQKAEFGGKYEGRGTASEMDVEAAD